VGGDYFHVVGGDYFHVAMTVRSDTNNTAENLPHHGGGH